MFPTKVLVAVDGSEEAEQSAREASRLCAKTGSELHVAHVSPPASAWTGAEGLAWQVEDTEYVRRIEETSEREGRRLLEEQVEKIDGFADGSGAPVEDSHLEMGRVDASVAGLAERLGAGLVVVGHRGYGALRRTLVGSVSMSLLHHAHCPVLVVRSPEEDPDANLTAKPVLVAYDGSSEAVHAARAGAELAGFFGTSLHIAGAVDMSKVIPYAPTYAQFGWEEEIERAEKETREWLEEEASRLETSGAILAELHVCNGRPSAEMVRLGESLGAGLILTGSRGRGGIKRALLGSVSTSVAQHALGSVLVFRPPESPQKSP